MNGFEIFMHYLIITLARCQYRTNDRIVASKRVADELRAQAELVERLPLLSWYCPAPSMYPSDMPTVGYCPLTNWMTPKTGLPDMRAMIAYIDEVMPELHKQKISSDARLGMEFRDGAGRIVVSVSGSRTDVCQRVQVGTKLVEVPDIPDVIASKYTKWVEEPVYEVQCDDRLLGGAS